MLINIDPILSPELLSILRSMGHGDKIVLCDANFPAASLAKRVIRIDGANIPRTTKAILSVMPLDSFIECPATLAKAKKTTGNIMTVDGGNMSAILR